MFWWLDKSRKTSFPLWGKISEDLSSSTTKTILASSLYSYLGITNLSMRAEKAQKILSPVPYEQGFHFFAPDGHYSDETAICLFALS